MANNRLFIRCKQCGKCIFIGKHFGGTLELNVEPESFVNALNDFYSEHFYCHKDVKEYKHSPIYTLELCEEFPGEMTDSHFDDENNYCPF